MRGIGEFELINIVDKRQGKNEFTGYPLVPYDAPKLSRRLSVKLSDSLT